MSNRILLIAVLVLPLFSVSAYADSRISLPIRPCPEDSGCGPLPGPIRPINPIPISMSTPVPAGTYSGENDGETIQLAVSESGATITETDSDSPSAGTTTIHLPELMMNSEGEFSALGSLYPPCDRGICPEYIEVIEISGVYAAADGSMPASITLSIQGATYQLVLNASLPRPEPIIPRPLPLRRIF